MAERGGEAAEWGILWASGVVAGVDAPGGGCLYVSPGWVWS